ncbi:MAG: type IV secretory system conjugative DNA transfer family protein [Anaerolineae bacterium]|nr:type IV secretory system conjugative DNA transfer family protein [Anaerolineae bacterium]
MIYWFLTTYRDAAGLYVGVPAILLALIGAIITAWALGTSGLKSSSGDLGSKQIHIMLPELLLSALAAMHLVLPIAAAVGLNRSRNQAVNAFLSLLLGPVAYDYTRLAIGGGILLGAGGLVFLLVYSQLEDGGWLRENINRLRDPMRRVGELGSAAFVSPGQMAVLQKDKGRYQLEILGAFYGTWGAFESAKKLRRIDRLAVFWKERGRLRFSLEDQARGTAIIGPPGTGKSQAGILPILGDSMKAGHSIILLDPQGELLPKVEDFARVTRHKVIVHDPTDPRTAHFNLADGITSVAEAGAIAGILIPPISGGDNQFWVDSARNLLAACLIRFETMGEILEHTDDMKHLGQQLSQGKDAAANLASAFSASVQADGRTAAGILAQLHSTALSQWAEPTVKLSTDRTDFSADKLVHQEPAVIVLRCPGRYMKVYGPYLAAILSKLMMDLDTLGEQHGGPCPLPVKVIIDEFPALGRLSQFPEWVNLYRKRHISFVIAMQSIAQLYDKYGKHGAETLIAGLALQVVFGSCDPATAQYVVGMLGKATQHVESSIFQKDTPARSQQQRRQRDLMTVDEVITPPKGNCTMLFRYATTTYAAQIVMLAKLTYMFERQDWRQAIDNNRHVPVPTELQVVGTAELFGRSAAQAQRQTLAVEAPILKAQPVATASEPVPLPNSFQVSLEDLLGDQAEDDVDDLFSDDF